VALLPVGSRPEGAVESLIQRSVTRATGLDSQNYLCLTLLLPSPSVFPPLPAMCDVDPSRVPFGRRGVLFGRGSVSWILPEIGVGLIGGSLWRITGIWRHGVWQPLVYRRIRCCFHFVVTTIN